MKTTIIFVYIESGKNCRKRVRTLLTLDVILGTVPFIIRIMAEIYSSDLIVLNIISTFSLSFRCPLVSPRPGVSMKIRKPLPVKDRNVYC